MKPYRSLLPSALAGVGMFILIVDSRTALVGAEEGIDLCIRTVIPALFPFFVLATILTSSLIGTKSKLLRPIGRLCGIPKGAECILLTGLLGGYPVGAQCISQAYATGHLTKVDARRMLGFCSNAGPAFLFGMSGLLFSNKSVPFLLWMIHILSAIMTGIILPGKSNLQVTASPKVIFNTGETLQKSLRVTANVCAWVLLFRIILTFLERWFLWLLPRTGQIVIAGFLELSNGYIALSSIENECIRFFLASIFLSFGGICVLLQTVSVTGQAGLDLGLYFPGKLIQCAISAVISLCVSRHLYRDSNMTVQYFLIAITMLGAGYIILAKIRKNSSSIPLPSVV